MRARKMRTSALLVAGLLPPVAARQAAAQHTIRYEFTPRPDSALMHVVLRFDAGGRATTRLELPSNWVVSGLWQHIGGLKGAAGVTAIDSIAPTARVVHHAREGLVEVSYVIHAPTHQRRTVAEGYYRPVIEHDRLFLLGRNALIVPVLDDARPWHCELQWKNVPRRWQLVNSFGAVRSGGTQRFIATRTDLLEAVFAGGRYQEHLTTTESGDELRVIWFGTWRFPPRSFVGLVVDLYKGSRHVWNDAAPRKTLTVLLPGIDPPGNHGGEAKTNAVILFASSSSPNVTPFQHTVAHELFHLWNPQRLGRYEESLYWFTEGVTDFYADVLLLRGGRLNAREFLESANEVLRKYDASPVRSISADSMVHVRGSSVDAERLPYQQGFLLALRWSTSAGKHPLHGAIDAGLATLLERSASGAALTHELISGALAAGGVGDSTSLARDIDRVVRHGVPVPFEPGALPCARIVDTLFPVLDPGFDIEVLSSLRTIAGVMNGSAAYKAGLRNGQRWVGGGITLDPRIQSAIIVQDSTGRRTTVTYYPARKEKQPVRQFVMSETSRPSLQRCLAALRE